MRRIDHTAKEPHFKFISEEKSKTGMKHTAACLFVYGKIKIQNESRITVVVSSLRKLFIIIILLLFSLSHLTHRFCTSFFLFTFL